MTANLLEDAVEHAKGQRTRQIDGECIPGDGATMLQQERMGEREQGRAEEVARERAAEAAGADERAQE